MAKLVGRNAPPGVPRSMTVGGRYGAEALGALARQMAASAPSAWPQAIVMLGDQVYADELSP